MLADDVQHLSNCINAPFSRSNIYAVIVATGEKNEGQLCSVSGTLIYRAIPNKDS